jgi:peptidoglycan/xylan/chitin deacetylase (PgdA/CDA1 family)
MKLNPRTRLALTACLLGALGAACRAPAPPTGDAQATDAVPGWEWSDEEVFATVNAVRAGRSLQPAGWPGGARVAVLLSFDVDNETIPLRYGEPTIGTLSQGEYGARVALPRVVDLLDERGIPASFFIPAMSLAINPGQIDVIRRAGHHEFAIHGWIHERNSQLSEAQERALLTRAVDSLTAWTGERPVGYRAPSWDFSPWTLGLIRELGFLYDSSLMADDRPYEIVADGEPTGVIELPVEWILDDAPVLNPLGDRYAPPRAALRVWIDEFDVAWEEGTMFLLTMHPHYIGHRSRIVVLEELIDHIQEKGDVWFATHRQAAEYVAAQAGMASP